MSRAPASIPTWIRRHLREETPRARSLIVTIFGDSVTPYRDGLWLGDLIALLRPFGVNERLVRTSVYRLAQAGWLVPRREGRRSYYALGPGGRRRFRHAYQRVYAPARPWDNGWTVAVLPRNGNHADVRAALRRELEWEGFAGLAPGVYLRPSDDAGAAREVVDELGLAGSVAIFEARAPDAADGRPFTALAAQCWNLAPAAEGYARFLDRFAPLTALIGRGKTATPEQSFVVQTLLIDAFRWATLHDPRLPTPLLPADWPGHAARVLCRTLYGHLFRRTGTQLATVLGADIGAGTIPDAVLERFGGIG
ncbi:MAG: phenylacetic acid degradation operon negative regulatory protein PaaX [Rhodanobacteraceae bacterium]